MQLRIFACAAPGLFLVSPPLFAQTQPELKPFVVDHRAGVADGLDLSFLNEMPAGKQGFIASRDGRLSTPDGKNIRLWGVNVTDWTRGSIQIPAKDDAAFWAKTLARYGVNVVRLTFIDFNEPRGLIAAGGDDTRRLSPAKLDDFDFWVNELKKNGIYSDISLLTGRTYKEGDGVAERELVGWAKGLSYFDPRLIELQKEFARQLLTHRNPYTELEYRSDPAVAVVELINENSLWDAWYYDRLHPPAEWGNDANFRPAPPYYSAMLDKLYNEYIAQKLTPEELAELRRTTGAAEGAPVPRMRKAEHLAAPARRMQLEADFVVEVERRYFREMKRFMRDDLGVKSMLLGSNDYLHEHSNYGMVAANMEMDVTDGHVYWQHPSWEGKVNAPMVNDPGFSTVARLSRTAVSGMPYFVTEVNNAWPNDYDAEGIPIVAAYGALQDWSAIMWYTFEPKLKELPAGRGGAAGPYEPVIGDAFDISHHPVKMAQLAAGALMYRRGDFAPAQLTIERTYAWEQVLESIRLPIYEAPYYTPGFPVSLALQHKMRIGSFNGPATIQYTAPRKNPIVSDTGELSWFTSVVDAGLVKADSPMTQALIGFVRDNKQSTRNMRADVTNKFCAITLSSLAVDSIASSNKLLLTTGARAENSGQLWDDIRRTTRRGRGSRGTTPTLIEPVAGEIALLGLEAATTVLLQPLDGAGMPLGAAKEAVKAGDEWRFAIGEPVTDWYVIEVKR